MKERMIYNKTIGSNTGPRSIEKSTEISLNYHLENKTKTTNTDTSAILIY